MKKHNAAIFDMDGVIIDSGPLHMEAWQQVFLAHGIEFSEDSFRARFGMRDSEVVPRLIATMSDEATVQLLNHKSQLFQELVQSQGRPVDGIVEFVAQLHERRIPSVVASNATAEEIQTVLQAVGLGDSIEIAVTRESSLPGKPAPDIFISASKHLGVTTEQSVVFEDAISGVEAARSAGATTVAITTSYSAGELSHADLVVENFTAPALIDFF